MTNTDVILQYMAHKNMDEYEFQACGYFVCWLFMSRFSCHYYDVLLLCATRMLRWLQKLLKVLVSIEGLRERTNNIDIFRFSAHH